MRTSIIMLLGSLWLVAVSGCGTDFSRTHRGDLLDDKVTAQRIQSALERAGPDFQRVDVGVTNNVVVLSGSVASPDLRSRAEQIARDVHRPMKLENDVEVQH